MAAASPRPVCAIHPYFESGPTERSVTDTGRDADCKHKVARWAPCKEESSVATEQGYQWCLTKGVEGKATADDRWRSHNYTFSAADVPGARYLLFEDGGVDSEYWTGWHSAASCFFSRGRRRRAPRTIQVAAAASPWVLRGLSTW